MKLKALYYPYAQSFDRKMLKQAILMFDEIYFSDPLERFVREVITDNRIKREGYGGWDSIFDDYNFLYKKGLIKRLDPRPIIREYDGLMAQSLTCDIQDSEFTQLATTSVNQGQGNWGILRERIDESFGMSHYLSDLKPFPQGGTRFWERPYFIKWPSDGVDKLYGYVHDFSSPYMMTIQHDYIPMSCGYSININHALLVSQIEGLTLFTDDVVALRLLNLKYQRARSQTGSSFKSSLLIKRTPEYLAKYSILALNVVQALLPSEELDRRSFADIVHFKETHYEMFEHFRSHLLELTTEISSEPWSETLESEIIKLIDTKIVPEMIKVRDDMHLAYEKMFGSIIKKTAAVLTPTLVASFLSGLSSGQILTLSCAAVAGALSIALPEITGLWQDRQQNKRNGLSFLLNLDSRHKS